MLQYLKIPITLLKMQNANQDFHAAQEIGKIYQSLTEKSSLASFFLESTGKFTGANGGFLYLSGRSGGLWLETRLSSAAGIEPPPEEQVLRIYEQGKPVLEKTVLHVPLLVRNHVLGLAVFTRADGQKPFAPDDLELALALGSQMAGALKNILLFEENVKMERLAAVGQTTGMVLHEIKNIMQLAKLSYEFVKKGVERNESKFLDRGMTNMQRALKEMEGFTRDMLSLTKDYALETQKVDLSGIFKELEEDLGDKATDFKVKLVFEVEPGFPEVDADARALYRTLLNLVKNAIEASDSTKEDSSIRVQAASAASDRYTIRVADNGVGMSPEVKARLFEAFFSTKGSQGTGLGLLIIDRTVKNHRGEIQIESEPGKGTCFTLTLPKTLSSAV